MKTIRIDLSSLVKEKTLETIPWHERIISDVIRLLSSYRNILRIETSPGRKRGPDIRVSRIDKPDSVVLIEVEQWASGAPFSKTVKRWAERHTNALATCIIAPVATLERLIKMVKQKNPAFSQDPHVFFFGDDQIEQLCVTVPFLLLGS